MEASDLPVGMGVGRALRPSTTCLTAVMCSMGSVQPSNDLATAESTSVACCFLLVVFHLV